MSRILNIKLYDGKQGVPVVDTTVATLRDARDYVNSAECEGAEVWRVDVWRAGRKVRRYNKMRCSLGRAETFVWVLDKLWHQ